MASGRGLRGAGNRSSLINHSSTGRSSRFSSPAVPTPAKDSEPTPAEGVGLEGGGRTFMDSWLEPPMAAPIPSYKHDKRGFEGIGTLEHMAPLGQPPTQKLLQKLKINGPRMSFQRSTPTQSEEVSTPTTDVERIDVASPVDTELQIDPVIISSPERGRPRKQENGGQVILQSNMTPSPVKTTFNQSSNTSPQSTVSTRLQAPEDVTFHLGTAIREAEQNGTRKLIPGLQKLQQDALTDPSLVVILEAVYHQSTTHEQFRRFKKYIKAGIKQYNGASSSETVPTSRTSSMTQIMSPRAPAINQPGTFPEPPHATSQTTSQAQPTPLKAPITLKQLASPLSHRSSPMKKVSRSPAASVHASNGSLKADATSSRPTASPSKRRSGSVSSSSSLSSVQSIKSIDEPFTLQLGDDRTNGGRAVRSAGQRQAAKQQKTRPSSVLPPSSDHPFSHYNGVSKFTSKKLKKPRDEPGIDYEAITRRRGELYNSSVHDYDQQARDESHERTLMHSHPVSTATISISRVPPPVVHAHPLEPSQATLSSPTTAGGPTLESQLHGGTSRKRSYNEIDGADAGMQTPRSSSPTLLLPPPSAAVASSRAATPRAAKVLPPAKARKSARVMVSPNKSKNGGITAGISRAGRGRDAIGNGVDSNAEDNDEYCASCGGEGKLLCCDGCPNSFHHACLEPPLDPEEEVDGEWFCPRCVARRQKIHTTATGLFGRIVQKVEDIIPKAYSLPYEIRDYWEGVKTGNEGEYEEIGVSKMQNNVVKMNRAGFIDEPNYKELRDSKGNIRLCYRCGLASHGRDIIPCDYCEAKWHLDCLSPPLAVPPRRRIGDKPNASWQCPLHIEQDLKNAGSMSEAAPGDLGRIPRLRKPKHVVPFDVSLGRGFRNNGVIEIQLEKDQIHEVEMQGQVYRLPEKAVKLDFIDRVKRSWFEDNSFPRLLHTTRHLREPLYRPEWVDYASSNRPIDAQVEANIQLITIQAKAAASANAVLRRKSHREQQAALNLVEFARKSDLPADKVSDLVNQLVAEAPDEVTRAVQDDERNTLLRLQELVAQRLAVVDGKSNPTQASVAATNGEQEEESDVEMDLEA